MADLSLPVDRLRAAFREAAARGPVVLSSPTGSGKSTRVPAWCAEDGRTVVVQPRRVACRALARRVAELDGTPLGERVGYHVRDDRQATDTTALVFATPGMVLRWCMRADVPLAGWQTLVLDEVHERSLDLDLLLGLWGAWPSATRPRLVLLSATVDAEALAAHVGGTALHADGRLHPVTIEHLGQGTEPPTADGLCDRVRSAVLRALEHPGDVLVFLPGKGEIRDAARALGVAQGSGATTLAGTRCEVLPLHGGLPRREEARVFKPGSDRRVVLSTNVAETSLTLPGIGVVVDAGLVRRTVYHGGRGFLARVPIARDSADQRAGRAGRLGPGVALRLWAKAARMEDRTPPEIRRERLAPLLLTAAMCGAPDVERLPLPTPAPEHALDDAREELRTLGALTDDGAVTPRGERLADLPIDPTHARILVEAEQSKTPGLMDAALDLVSAVGGDRPLWAAPPTGHEGCLRSQVQCDVHAAVAVMRLEGARPGRLEGLRPGAVDDARRLRKRLCRALGVSNAPSGGALARPTPLAEAAEHVFGAKLRSALSATILAADPRTGHVGRRHGRRLSWANGGPEIELDRHSAVSFRIAHAGKEGPPEALVVVTTRAVDSGQAGARGRRVLATCASPLTLRDLARAGLGEERAAAPSLERRKVVCTLERVFAGRVIGTRDDVPEGPAAREALAALILRGSVFKKAFSQTRERLEARALAAALDGEAGPPSAEDWLAARIEEIGFTRGDELELLGPEDVLAEDLDAWRRQQLDRDTPRELNIAGVGYRIRYEIPRRTAVLVRTTKGGRKGEAPSQRLLPRLAGWKVELEDRGTRRVLRERR